MNKLLFIQIPVRQIVKGKERPKERNTTFIRPEISVCLSREVLKEAVNQCEIKKIYCADIPEYR